MIATELPRLRLDAADPAAIEADVLVVALAGRDGAAVMLGAGVDEALCTALEAAAAAVGHSASAGTTARVPAPAGVHATSVLLVGVGDAAETTHDLLRTAAGSALRALDRVTTVALALPVQDADDAEAVATGALLGAYRHTAHRSSARLTAAGITRLERLVVAAPEAARPGLDRADVVARAVAAARDLVNASPLDLFPASFADAVLAQAGADAVRGRVHVDVLDESVLAERGFGGLVGVGSGSARPPRLVRVAYEPEGAARHLALVGKGITFDSGGLSIKPAAGMEKMKSDMAGAAAVVQALLAIATLGLPVRVTAWLALAENMPSGSAVRPSDVLRIYGGTTVEVTNTDAEGRLVLADALVVAQEESPDLLVDVATLTGAQVAALGYRTSGVMGTEAATERVVRAARAVGEPTWPMPIPAEMRGYLDSSTADLKNAGAKAGGMLAAAAFLGEFVAAGVEWAHLDVAGPAYTADAPHGFTTTGGTGVPVRTLVELARSMADGG